MKKCKSSPRNQNPSFSSFEELIDWAKEEYNTKNFTNGNNFSFLEIVDWRK